MQCTCVCVCVCVCNPAAPRSEYCESAGGEVARGAVRSGARVSSNAHSLMEPEFCLCLVSCGVLVAPLRMAAATPTPMSEPSARSHAATPPAPPLPRTSPRPRAHANRCRTPVQTPTGTREREHSRSRLNASALVLGARVQSLVRRERPFSHQQHFRVR